MTYTALPIPVKQLPSFIGTGPAYPWRLDVTRSRILVARDDQVIRASIDQILNTDITERPFTTKNGIPFGTRIRRIQFDSAQTAISVIKYEVKRALVLWEPRIIVESVDGTELPQPNGGSAIVAVIDYRYRATNLPDNYVVPFTFTRPNP